MNKLLLLVVIFAAGVTQPVQAAMNARLKEGVGSPTFPGLVAFLLASAVLGALTVLGVGGRARLADAATVPWWAWLGGLSAALLVTATLVAVKETGAAASIAAVVAGQTLAALAIDHYGWLEVDKTPASPWRIAGTALVIGGMLLLQKK